MSSHVSSSLSSPSISSPSSNFPSSNPRRPAFLCKFLSHLPKQHDLRSNYIVQELGSYIVQIVMHHPLDLPDYPFAKIVACHEPFLFTGGIYKTVLHPELFHLLRP